LVVTPAQLDWVISYATAHYECGALRETHLRLLEGRAKPRPQLAITFDDGQWDNYAYAAPVLAKHGVKATFFVPVDAVESQSLLWHDRLGFAVREVTAALGARRVFEEAARIGATLGEGPLESVVAEAAKALTPSGRRELTAALERATAGSTAPAWSRLMTWEQIRALGEAGHEVGSHSMSHTLLPQCSQAELDWEVRESRRVLCERLGGEVDSFCYPNGDSSEACEAAVCRAGYQRAVITRAGVNAVATNRFALARFDMDCRRVIGPGGRLSRAQLAWRMSGLHPGVE
jgi:peptidoglycan/xylan/chitin deacetylase (PgdA/CDA1 family)